MRQRRWWTAAGLATLVIVGSATVTLWQAKPAHANYPNSSDCQDAPSGTVSANTFICPSQTQVNNGNDRWDVVDMTAQDTNPSLQTASNNNGYGAAQPGSLGGATPTTVYPGDVITINMAYHVNKNYTGNTDAAMPVFAWIGMGDPGGFADDLYGGLTASGPAGATQITPTAGAVGEGGSNSYEYQPNFSAPATATDGNYNGQTVFPVPSSLPACDGTTNTCADAGYTYASGGNNCPSFYNGPNSNYAASSYPSYEDNSLAGTAYPTTGSPNGGSDQPFPGYYSDDHTCGTQGKSVMWEGNSSDWMNTPNHDYDFNVTLTINATTGDDHPFCIRGSVAVYDPTTEAARTTNYGCFAEKEVTASGYITSDPTAATGRGLNGVPITVNHNCLGGSNHTATTTNDSSGNPGYYSFNTIEGAQTCITPPGSFSDPATNTNYNNPTPAPGFPSNVCTADCGGFNFYYQPIPNAMPPSKISNPSSGTSVVPGQSMAFSMSASNPIDSNTSGEVLADEVPLNINPSTVGAISASLSTVGPGPPGWTATANPGISCAVGGVITDFYYGYGDTSNIAAVNCGYSPPNGTTPGYIFVAMSNMPAYSQLTLNWGGSVVPASEVGVYPTNGAYCNNGSVNFGSPNSIFGDPLSTAGCQNFSTGLQGVSNFAYDEITDDMTPALSNETYNPIPGTLSCVGKDTTAHTQYGDPLSIGTGACGTNTPAAGDKWVYSTGDPTYSSAAFRILVGQTPTAASEGPVYYSVIDQNDGAATTTTGAPLNPALQKTSGLSGNGVQVGAAGSQWLKWPNEYSLTIPAGGYTFNDNFTNVSDGYVASNSTKACWPQYWTSGYPVSCVTQATPLTVTQQKITNPFVTTSNGDIHAGGGTCSPTDSPQQPVTTAEANPQTRQNPGATGQYFVSATGPLNGAADKAPFFTSNSGVDSNSYGVVCRPDIVTSTENYAAMPGNVVIVPAGTLNTANQSAWDGKVVEAFGNVNIPAGTVIDDRWTLLVHGNVNITGSGAVTVANPTLNGNPEAQHASFGVVIDNGNLNIDKGITELDGFYFVAPQSGTDNNGRVNTCAGPQESPTLGSGYQTTDCQTPLVIKGLMMANAFRLDRTTDPGSGPTPTNPAEFVQFDDRLYTATPPGFSDLSQTYLPPIYLPETNPRY